MAVKSYGFAIGNLRARENSLLKQSDFSQLLSAQNTEEFAKLLKDKGIGAGSSSDDALELIKSHTKQLWQYLEDIAPDMSVFEPFIYENDFHNLKAILKSVLKAYSFEHLLIVPAIVDVSKIETAIKNKQFDLLPEFMSSAAKEAYEILSQTGDAQLADGIIDAACMASQLKRAQESKQKICIEIIKIIVFYGNIKVALRAARANKNAEFLNSTLTETEVLPKKELVNAALSGEEKVLELLSKTYELSGEAAAEEYKKSAWRLEKFADDLIIKKVLRLKNITMGIEPLIGYMCARKTELQNLRIIYSGVKTGQAAEKTKERLRELYG